MKTELYTALHSRSIRIAALALPIVAAFTSILAWILGITVPEELPQGFTPDSTQFQLQALDITGSAQSSGIAGSYIVASVLGVLMVSTNYRHDAVTWKVLHGRGAMGREHPRSRRCCNRSGSDRELRDRSGSHGRRNATQRNPLECTSQ